MGQSYSRYWEVSIWQHLQLTPWKGDTVLSFLAARKPNLKQQTNYTMLYGYTDITDILQSKATHGWKTPTWLVLGTLQKGEKGFVALAALRAAGFNTFKTSLGGISAWLRGRLKMQTLGYWDTFKYTALIMLMIRHPISSVLMSLCMFRRHFTPWGDWRNTLLLNLLIRWSIWAVSACLNRTAIAIPLCCTEGQPCRSIDRLSGCRTRESTEQSANGECVDTVSKPRSNQPILLRVVTGWDRDWRSQRWRRSHYCNGEVFGWEWPTILLRLVVRLPSRENHTFWNWSLNMMEYDGILCDQKAKQDWSH